MFHSEDKSLEQRAAFADALRELAIQIDQETDRMERERVAGQTLSR